MAEVCISGILHFLLLYVIFSTCLALTLGAARFTASPPTNIVSSNTTIRLNWVYVVDDKDGEFKDNSPIWEYKGVGSRWLKIAFEDGLDGWKWKLSSECPPKFKNPVRVGKESVATLVIVNTTTDDSGLYRCTLDMALGGPIYSDEVQLTITASTTPSPTTPPTPVQTTVSPTTTATTATESTTTTTSAPPADFTYEVIIREAKNCVWSKDLRQLPAFTFVQLYDYLVKKTSKYSNLDVSSSAGYKKLKAFNFFKEGRIKDLQLYQKDNLVYVKAEVLASMKSEKYKSVLVFDRTTNNIARAACKCPAGRGKNGMGRCNHIGGIIFAIEDFNRCGLREKDQLVSCTSLLCGWNVPRNMKVEPRPIDKIIFQKIRYGKATTTSAKITSYDPRAPADRDVDSQSLATMGEKLSCCLKSSSFFLFHNIKPSNSSSIQIDSICESIPNDVIDVDEFAHAEACELQDVPFNDDYDINSKAFKEIIDCYVKEQRIMDEEIKDIEGETMGQSDNDAWKKLKETVLTASNFKKAVIRRKEPDTLLRNIMYINGNKQKVIPSLDYGIQHEGDAVQCYVALHHAAGNNLRVAEVGTKVSKETPGLGASLDRLVYNPPPQMEQKED